MVFGQTGGGGGIAGGYAARFYVGLATDPTQQMRAQAGIVVNVLQEVFKQIGALESRGLRASVDEGKRRVGELNSFIEDANGRTQGALAQSAAHHDKQVLTRFAQDVGTLKQTTSQSLGAQALGAQVGGQRAIGTMERFREKGEAGGWSGKAGLGLPQKAYHRFFANLKRDSESTAIAMGKSITFADGKGKKLLSNARQWFQNYRDAGVKGAEAIKVAFKSTQRELDEEILTVRALRTEIKYRFGVEDEERKKALAHYDEALDNLKVEKNAISSLSNQVRDYEEAQETARIKEERRTQKAIDDKAREEAQIKENEEAILKLKRANMELARSIAGKVNMALGNFRGILQQTSITLGLIYWRIQQLTGALFEFDKQLINAQSIWQTSDEQLYGISNELLRFGESYGIAYGEASEILYQFASAGIEADEAMEILNSTLKLSMAVQGDANTIGKLTVQTIKGFGLEMSQAEEVTDKMAYTINKSLVEWRDLSSAVKFAMPFFVAAGQSIDQLYGSLTVLTDRALEAGIAGRGLRQAIAEFVQHAEDSSAAFRQLGVEILDTEGNMRPLTDIAMQFNDAMGDNVSDMEVMISLMEDLNIRGATAFIHLVQNADEFRDSVDDLTNSAGASAEMAEIQQRSLTNQVQMLKNAMIEPFLLADEVYIQQGYMNEFHKTIVDITEVLAEFFIIEKDGTKVLTENGFIIRNLVIRTMKALAGMLEKVMKTVEKLTEAGLFNMDMIKLWLLPLSLAVWVITNIDAGLGKLIITLYILNRSLGIGYIGMGLLNFATAVYSNTLKLKFVPAAVAGEAGFWRLAIAGKTVEFTMWSIAAAMGTIALGIIGFAIGFLVIDRVMAKMPLWAKWAFVLAAAIAAVVIAASGGGAAVSIMAGMVAVGATIAALKATFDIGMPSGYTSLAGPEYDAYMSSLEGSQSSINANAASTEGQVLYIDEAYFASTDMADANYNAQYSGAGSG